jgi:mono/diheme cytochrome c family protein
MMHTAPRSILILVVLMFSTVTLSMAQEKGKTVKKVPIQHTSPASGGEMFKSYCSACHGKDAKGGGPASVDLKSTPPDLTTLAQRHEGKFPAEYVTTVLRNGITAPAHGTTDMPVWGPILASVSGHDQTVVNMRISNLVRYLESLQVK